MASKIKAGDRVAYSVAFLRSIGMSHSDMAHGRATVLEITPLGSIALASLQWDSGTDLPERVNVCNLARVGGPGFSAL